MIRNIIFDWSGTLVDDLPAVWQATNHVFQLAGVDPLTLDEFRAEFSLPFRGFYDRYLPHVPLTDLEAWFHGRFREVEDAVVEMPHARDFLSFCRERQLRTFVLSTVHREAYQRQSARLGLEPFFDAVYLGVHDKREKILHLLTENKLDPRQTVFVGDMQHDVETAQHGGVFSCAVLTGYNRLNQLRASHPDFIVEHLGEFRRILEKNGMELHSHSPPDGEGLPVVTVGAVIYNDAGKFLMIRTQKWSGLWGIPGGKVNLGEAALDALRREIKEETDLDVADIRFVMVQDCIRPREFYRDAHFVLLNYRCQCSGNSEVTLNYEAQEYCWVSHSDALALSLNQPTRVLLDVLAKLAMPTEP